MNRTDTYHRHGGCSPTNVHLFICLSHVQTNIKHMISNNPDLLLVSIWIILDSFPHIFHNQALSLLWSTLPPTWTLGMSLLKASEYGEAVDYHRFGLFLFDTINTTWIWYLELINEFKMQPRGYGKKLNSIEPNKSQHSVVSIQTGSRKRRPPFLHTISFEWTTKL